MNSRLFFHFVCFGIAGALFFWAGVRIVQKYDSATPTCHHDGVLDHIDFAQTWRIRFAADDPRTTFILGVCKKCGRAVDLERREAGGSSMQFPLAGNKWYDEDFVTGSDDENTPQKKTSL